MKKFVEDVKKVKKTWFWGSGPEKSADGSSSGFGRIGFWVILRSIWCRSKLAILGQKCSKTAFFQGSQKPPKMAIFDVFWAFWCDVECDETFKRFIKCDDELKLCWCSEANVRLSVTRDAKNDDFWGLSGEGQKRPFLRVLGRARKSGCCERVDDCDDIMCM